LSGIEIQKVRIAVGLRNFNDLVMSLGEADIIHLGSSSLIDCASGKGKMIREKLKNVEFLLSDILNLTNDLENYGGIPGSVEKDIPQTFEIRKDTEYLKNIKSKIRQYDRVKRSLLQNETESLENITELNELLETGIDPAEFSDMEMCSLIFGKVNAQLSEDDTCADESCFIRQSGAYVLAICRTGDTDRITRILDKYQFTDMMTSEMEPVTLMISHEEKKLRNCRMRLQTVENTIKQLKTVWISDLTVMYDLYLLKSEILDAGRLFSFSKDVMFIDGWVGINNLKKLIASISKVCGRNYYLEIIEGEELAGKEEKKPVILRNNRLFRPFELLVKNLGIPGDKELDPTPVAAMSYVIMFGLMFGDAGQGLLLAFSGFIIKNIYKKNKEKKTLYELGGILIYSGLSAAVFGILYGSVFSLEHLFEPVWFSPMQNVMGLFTASIIMGVFIISIGMLLNMINNFIRGNFTESLLGVRGAAGMIVYLWFVKNMYQYLSSGAVMGNVEFIIFFLLPLCLFILRNPVGYVFFEIKQVFPDGFFEYLVGSIVQLIEMFSGLLSNTVSFIRAGAFALSHAGLSIAVYTLAESTGGVLSAGGIVVMIIGNIFIILLEGLLCSIQSMRLEYYEFFSRFFSGDGVEFRPFSFRKANTAGGRYL